MSKKRGAEVGAIASLLSPRMTRALPRVVILVNGKACEALVDTGCVRTLVEAGWAGEWTQQDVVVITANEQRWKCAGVATAVVEVSGGACASVEAYVMNMKPLGFACILGMDAIGALGGVTVRGDAEVTFGVQVNQLCAVVGGEKKHLGIGVGEACEKSRPSVAAGETRGREKHPGTGVKRKKHLGIGVEKKHLGIGVEEKHLGTGVEEKCCVRGALVRWGTINT